MPATSDRTRALALIAGLIALVILTTQPAASGASPASTGLWYDPGVIATSVEIDDEAIVIRTEPKDGGGAETIKIVPEGGDYAILREGGSIRDSRSSRRKHVRFELDDLDRFDGCHSDDAVVRFGEDIHVRENESIDGDVLAVGGSVYIDGDVDGDVVALGGSVSIGPRASVDGDVVAVAGDLTLDRGCSIEGDAVSVGGWVDDLGAIVNGDVVTVEFDLW